MYMYCNVQYMTKCTCICAVSIHVVNIQDIHVNMYVYYNLQYMTTCTCICSKYSKYSCSQYTGYKHVRVLQSRGHDYMYMYIYMYMYM